MINDKELLAMIRDPKTQREGFAVLVSQYSEPLYLEGSPYCLRS